MPPQTRGQRHVGISDYLEKLARAGRQGREGPEPVQDEMHLQQLTRNGVLSAIRTAVGSSTQQMGMRGMLCSFNHI